MAIPELPPEGFGLEPLGQLPEPAPVIDIRTAPGYNVNPQTGIPLEGAPITLPTQHAQSTWDDVRNWVWDQNSQRNSAASSALSKAFVAVEDWVSGLIGDTTAALGGMVNLAVDYTSSVWDDVYGMFALYQAEIADLNDAMKHYVGNVARWAYVDSLAQWHAILNNAMRLPQALADQAGQIWHDLTQWAIQEIYWPLDTRINHLTAQVENLLPGTSGMSAAEVASMISARTAPLLQRLAVVEPAVAKLAQESIDCVEPLCAEFGPKSDLGQLAKLVNWAKWAAIIAEIAAISDKSAAEHLARLIVSLERDPARLFTEAFFGERLP